MLMPLLSPDALHAPPDGVSRRIIVRALHQLPELLSHFPGAAAVVASDIVHPASDRKSVV